jgi:hypothetical protein
MTRLSVALILYDAITYEKLANAGIMGGAVLLP